MKETRPRRMAATTVARVCFDFVEPAQEECSLVIGLLMYGTFEFSTFFRALPLLAYKHVSIR